GATGVPATTAVTVTFSESMSAASVSSSTIMLTNGGVTVPATVAYSAATLTATLTPSAPLAATTTDSVVVKGGTGGDADTSGNSLVSDVSWSFTTAGDTTPPTVTSIAPANGATGVATSSVVTVVFSETLSAASVSGSTILLTNGGTTVAATVAYNAATLTATL